MGAWPTLFVASGASGATVIAATAGKARRLASMATGLEEGFIVVEEVPLADAVKVLRIPAGPLPGTVPAPAAVRPADEPVAPARRSDPETAQRAAAAARRLGANRRTEILRFVVGAVRDGGSRWDTETKAPVLDGMYHGITESELTRRFGGVPGGSSKRISELIDGAWLYSRGTRPSVSTGTAQRVCFPTSGAIEWVASHPREA